MKRFKTSLITGGLILGALAAPALALADAPAAATPAPTPAATPTPIPWYNKVTVGGYVEEYYQQSFTQPSALGFAPNDRVFDNTSNQFSFGGGELTLKQGDTPSGTGYFVDLLLGPKASIYNNSGLGNDAVQIGQAYVTQAFGNATFTLGKFGTPIGYEVTYTPSNPNFSRSLLFSQEPYFNTGLRLDYTLPAGLVASGFVDDGNSLDNAVTSGKDYGLILAYSGINNLSLTGLWYLNPTPSALPLGQEENDWFNFQAAYTLNSSLSFTGEYLYHITLDPTASSTTYTPWSPKEQGYALYSTYNTSIANLSLSPRFEQWFAPDGYNTGSALGTGGVLNAMNAATPDQVDELTVTLKYVMGPLSHILEYRTDVNTATWGAVPLGSKVSTADQTLTYAAIYAF